MQAAERVRALDISLGDSARERRNARKLFVLMSCGGCGRGGLATVEDSTGQYLGGRLVEFYPAAIERASLPSGVPKGVAAEFREAELVYSRTLSR